MELRQSMSAGANWRVKLLDKHYENGCINEHGQESYRRIIARHDQWFEGDRHQITARSETMVQEEWRSILERVAAILVNDEDDV